MKTYMIPGLGNDRRIFSNLSPKLKVKDIEYIEYADPVSKKQSISEYVDELVNRYNFEENANIIGMSMGGVLTVELAKRIKFRKIFLISTFKHDDETPFIFKIARFFPIYILVPAFFIRLTIPFFARILGICNAEETRILKEMLYDRTNIHFAWGRRAIVNWSNNKKIENCVHINGTSDHIFLKANKNADYLIKKGTHNMVMDRSEEIAEIINKLI